MKVLKNALQKNVILNKDFYTDYKIRELLNNKEICFFDDNFNENYDYTEYVRNFREPVLHLFLKQGDELKVEENLGYYTNVLIKNDGSKYFIIL